MLDDPCDNIVCLATWAKWANHPASGLSHYARIWLKGTSFEY